MSLQPLPQAVITAQRLREQAQQLILLAEELEASAPKTKPAPGSGVFMFGEVKPRRRK
jgi:hypothetical protein